LTDTAEDKLTVNIDSAVTALDCSEPIKLLMLITEALVAAKPVDNATTDALVEDNTLETATIEEFAEDNPLETADDNNTAFEFADDNPPDKATTDALVEDNPLDNAIIEAV